MKKEKKKQFTIIILSLVIVIFIGCILCFSLRRKERQTMTELEHNNTIIQEKTLERKNKIEETELNPNLSNTPDSNQKEEKKANENNLASSYMQGSIPITTGEKDSTKNKEETIEKEQKRQEEPTEETEMANENTTSDEVILTYIKNADINYTEKEKNHLKNAFITIVDFLFYDGTINGVTKDEITTKTKLNVLTFALKLDQQIEKIIPNYKETISTKTGHIYTNIKEKGVEMYLQITMKLCENNEPLCEDAKQGFHDMKTSFGISWNFIKNITQTGINNLKDWYEIYSGK